MMASVVASERLRTRRRERADGHTPRARSRSRSGGSMSDPRGSARVPSSGSVCRLAPPIRKSLGGKPAHCPDARRFSDALAGPYSVTAGRRGPQAVRGERLGDAASSRAIVRIGMRGHDRLERQVLPQLVALELVREEAACAVQTRARWPTRRRRWSSTSRSASSSGAPCPTRSRVRFTTLSIAKTSMIMLARISRCCCLSLRQASSRSHQRRCAM